MNHNSDRSQNINVLYSKVELYFNRLMNINHKCTGSVIRELCETRDSCNTQLFGRKELFYLMYTIISIHYTQSSFK